MGFLTTNNQHMGSNFDYSNDDVSKSSYYSIFANIIVAVPLLSSHSFMTSSLDDLSSLEKMFQIKLSFIYVYLQWDYLNEQ
jgi:hypothetical protein